MSQPSGGVPPYRVSYSGLCRDETRRLLARVGDPLRDLAHLGIQERIGSIAPLVVTYGVDEARHIVYVVIPFRLLSGSGL